MLPDISTDGCSLGKLLGIALGTILGKLLGTSLGETLGIILGDTLGDLVGTVVGDILGVIGDEGAGMRDHTLKKLHSSRRALVRPVVDLLALEHMDSVGQNSV